MKTEQRAGLPAIATKISQTKITEPQLELDLKSGRQADCFGSAQEAVFEHPDRLNYVEGVLVCYHLKGTDCGDSECKYGDFGFLPHGWVVDRLTGTIHELTIPNPHPDDVYVKILEQDKDELAEAMKQDGELVWGNMQVDPYVRVKLLEEAGYDLTEYRKKYELLPTAEMEAVVTEYVRVLKDLQAQRAKLHDLQAARHLRQNRNRLGTPT